VSVELDQRKPPTIPILEAALKAQGLDATVDDHSVWIKDIKRAASTVRLLGAVVFLLIAAATAAVITFATRAGLATRHDVVEVLHLTGAEDAYIARLFQISFARLAGVAGAAGAFAAAVVGAALRLAGGGQGLTPALPIAWTDLLVILPCPLLAAAVAALMAQRTALRLIRNLQ
jgi:cell division transport system permease protein